MAPGHETESPSQQELRELCNIGYAAECGRLPREREWDSIRFGAKATRIQESGQGGDWIMIRYVCEREHRPAEHGVLEFQAAGATWKQKHRDARLQRMAECFLETWLKKKQRMTGVSEESGHD
jgi:hypothetical protein